MARKSIKILVGPLLFCKSFLSNFLHKMLVDQSPSPIPDQGQGYPILFIYLFFSFFQGFDGKPCQTHSATWFSLKNK